MDKRRRLFQFLFALVLSFGMLFFSARTVFAEEDNPAAEEGSGETNENTNVQAQDTPVIVDYAPVNVVSEGGEVYTPEAIVGAVEAYYSDTPEEAPAEGNAEGFADVPAEGNSDPVTPAEVVVAITDAQLAEGVAGVVALPAGGETTGEIVTDEAVAVIVSESAKDSIHDANNIPDPAEATAAEQAISEFEDANDDAADNVSIIDIGKSEIAEIAAEVALIDAQNAETKSEAQEAAERAQKAYEHAQKYADDANQALEVATQKKADAEAAYQAAKDAYDLVMQQAQAELSEGEKDLEYAVIQAEDAMRVAYDYYKQAEAEEADAIAARDQAMADFESSKLSLEEAIKNLPAVIGEAAGETAGYLVESVESGIGQGLSEVAVKYYEELVAYKLWLIEQYQDDIKSAEKQFAAELQRRLEEDTLSEEEIDLIRVTLTELIVDDLLDTDDIDKESISWDINRIEGMRTQKPEWSQNGHFFSVEDNQGNSYYFFAEVVNGSINYYPIETKEFVTGDYPVLSEVLKKEKGQVKVIKLSDYGAVVSEEDNTYEGNVYAIEYKKNRQTIQTYIVPESDTYISILKPLLYTVNFFGDSFVQDYGYLTQTFEDNTSARLFKREILIDPENYTDSSSIIVSHEYHPVIEDTAKPLSQLFSDYDAFFDEQNTKIDSVTDEIYGDGINKYLQETLPQFINNNTNQEKFISILHSLTNPSENQYGIIDTVMASLDFENFDWSELSLDNLFTDGLDSFKKYQTASILDAAKGIASNLFNSSNKNEETSWDFSAFNLLDLLDLVNVFAADSDKWADYYGDIITITEAIVSNNFDSTALESFLKVLGNFSFADNTKLTIAQSINTIMTEWHGSAKENLSNSITTGKDNILEALEDIRTAAENTVRDGVELGKAELGLIPAKIKKGYALLLYGTTVNAYVRAYEAKELFSAYKDGFQPKKLVELTERLNDAEAELERLEKRAAILNKNADDAKNAADEAQKIADEFIEYNIWIQGTKVTSKNQNDVLKDGKISVTVESVDSDPEVLSATVLLNNADIDVVDLEDEIHQDLSAGIYASGFYEFTVKIKGDANKIKASSLGGSYSDTVAGIYVTDTTQVNIENGTAEEGGNSPADSAVLTIDTNTALAPFATKYNYGIFADRDLSIYQVTLNITSGSAIKSLIDSVSYGIYSNTELYINNGSDINAVANNAHTSAGIASDAIVSINDSDVKVEGAAAVNSYGIVSDQIYIYNADVKASSGTLGAITAGLYATGSSKDDGKGQIAISNNSSVIASGRYATNSSYGIFADRLDISDSEVEAYSDTAFEESVAVKVTGSNEDFPAISLNSSSSDDSTSVLASLIAVSKSGSILWYAPADYSNGIETTTISVDDRCKVSGTAGKASEGSFGIECDKITLSGTSYVSGTGGKADYSIGILGDVVCDNTTDDVIIEGRGGEGDTLSYGIMGDLTVNGTGDYFSHAYATGGKANDFSIGLYGNLNANGNFIITISSDDCSTKNKNSASYGLFGNVDAKGNAPAEGEEDVKSLITVTSGEAAFSIGIYGQSINDEEETTQVKIEQSALSVLAGASRFLSAGIYSPAIYAMNNAEISAYVGSEDSSSLAPEDSYAIFASFITADNSNVSGTINIPSGKSSTGIYAKNYITAVNKASIIGMAYIADDYSVGIATPVLNASASIISALADSSENSVGLSSPEVNIYNGSSLSAEVRPTYAKPKQSIGLDGNLNIIHNPDSGKNTAIISSSAAEEQSIGLNGNLSATGEFKAEITSGNAAESYGILGNLTTEGVDEENSIIKIKTGDATDKSIGIKGDVNLDKTYLEIKTGDVSDVTAENLTLSSDGILRAGTLKDFIAPVSAGINGGVTAMDSLINISAGSGALNYGIAAFDENGGKDISFDHCTVVVGDPERGSVVTLASIGISAGTNGELSVKNSNLFITADNVKEGFNGSGSTALSPIKISISEGSTVYAAAGDADYSCGVDTPGTLIISDSELYATAGNGRRSACGILASEVSLTNKAFLRSEATQGENGIGLSGKLNALDISQVALRGSYKALEYLEGFEPDFAGRDPFISYAVNVEAPFDLWKGEYPLNSDKYKKLIIGLRDKSDYTVVSGADATWTMGSTDPLAVRIQNADKSKDKETFSRFVKALVDGKELERDVDYTATEGSVIINLLPSFLNKLEEGKHLLTAVFSDGDDVNTHFFIKKKSSGGGSSDSSSSGKSSSKTSGSSVVTCQMAGYPDGYAWNEAAKACQPGFLDANGVFHGTGTVTATRRYSSPNTADSRGYLIALISSILAAITCAYVLKQDEA